MILRGGLEFSGSEFSLDNFLSGAGVFHQTLKGLPEAGCSVMNTGVLGKQISGVKTGFIYCTGVLLSHLVLGQAWAYSTSSSSSSSQVSVTGTAVALLSLARLRGRRCASVVNTNCEMSRNESSSLVNRR